MHWHVRTCGGKVSPEFADRGAPVTATNVMAIYSQYRRRLHLQV
jgi:hypothetical protein